MAAGGRESAILRRARSSMASIAGSRIRPKEGDVFTIPVDKDRIGFGQIHFKSKGPGPIFLVIFEALSKIEVVPSVEQILQTGPILAGCSMDALLKIAHWKIVGNHTTIRSDIPLPFFKTGTKNACYLEDFYGRRIRKATIEEAAFFDNPFSRAPIAFENALKAHHRLAPWLESYEKLTIKYLSEHSRLR